ncbi:MAG: hypothetical protein ABI430_02895 [Candidatus Taylorbacteria bacterium]
MDKKSKTLVAIIILLVFFTIGYTFYKTIILQDFITVDTSDQETGDESLDSQDI